MGQKVFSTTDEDKRKFRDIKALLKQRLPIEMTDIAVFRWMMDQALIVLAKPQIEVRQLTRLPNREDE